MKKVYVVGNSKHYSNAILDAVPVADMKEADIIIFTGGEDVDPIFYGEKKHPFTYSNEERDFSEMAEFNRAVNLNKFIVGICRGSQFLTVMNGGKLIQDVNNHGLAGFHKITFNDGFICDITSTHHQMMYPYNLNKKDYKVIAVSSDVRSDIHENGDGNNVPMTEEPEIVWYPKKQCFCIQGHPEYMKPNSEAVIKINQLINQYGKF